MATQTRLLKMSMIGVGVGGTEILPAMETMPEIDLYAGADINPLTRQRFKERYPEAEVYDSIESLCADPDVEAVWVSTPNRFHAPYTIYALEHGKHVVVRSPWRSRSAKPKRWSRRPRRTAACFSPGTPGHTPNPSATCAR